MPYSIKLPDGRSVDNIPDEVTPQEAKKKLSVQFPEFAPQTELLSLEGAKGLVQSVLPSIAGAIEGQKYGAHQELLDGMKISLKALTPGTLEYYRQEKKIQDQEKLTKGYSENVDIIDKEVKRVAPNPSEPMQAAMGVVPSIVQMAPSLLTRSPMPLAQQGLQNFQADSYGQARKEKASPEEAQKYAGVTGPMEAITEWMPIGKLFADLGKVGTAKLIAKTMGREVASEEVNTAVERAMHHATVTPDMPLDKFLEDWGSAARVTAMQAGMQTAVMSPLIKGINEEAAKGEETPGSTNRNPREDEIITAPPLPTPEERAKGQQEPAVEMPVEDPIVFTDTEEAMAQYQSLIDQVDAELAAGTRVVESPGDYHAVVETANPAAAELDARQAHDTGMSREVLTNKDNFKDPNTWVKRSTRRITRALGMAEGVGSSYGTLDLAALDTSKGPVVLQVGEDSDVRPAHYLQSIVAEVYDLAREFNPNAVYVILPEDAAITSMERGTQGYHFKQKGVHYIVPRHLTNQLETGEHASKQGTEGAYNANARLQAGSTLWHEFGHSLIEDFIFAGAGKQQQSLLRAALETGTVTPELLQGLAPEAAALINKWGELKQAIENGDLAGFEAAARWVSPAKLANKTVMRQKILRMSEGTMTKTHWNSARLAKGLGETNMNFFEFAAEQMAKYQMQEGKLENSKIIEAVFPEGFDSAGFEASLKRFFAPMLEALQKLFKSLQARNFVKPEAEFTQWLEQLAAQAQPEGGQKAKKVKKTKKGKVIAQPEPLDEEKDIDWESKDIQATLKASIASLLKTGMIEIGSPQHQELKQLLKDGMYEEFVDTIEPLLEKKLNFDIVGVRAQGITPVREAQKLLQSGLDAKAVIKKTGWWLGKDLKWRYEISSEKAKVLAWPTDLFKEELLENVLHHPELYKAYPALRNVKVSAGFLMPSGNGAYSSKHNQIYLGAWTKDSSMAGAIDTNLGLLLHEVQHAIQTIEGFAPGGSSKQFTAPSIEKGYDRLLLALNTFFSSPKGEQIAQTIADSLSVKYNLRYPIRGSSVDVLLSQPTQFPSLTRYSMEGERIDITVKDVIPFIKEFPELRPILVFSKAIGQSAKHIEGAYNKYRNLLGEIEARATSDRMRMTQEERRDTPVEIPDDFIIDWTAAGIQGSFSGSAVAKHNKDLLTVFHTQDMRFSVDGQQVFAFSANPMEAGWLGSLQKQQASAQTMLPFNVRMLMPMQVDLAGMRLTPQILQAKVREAKVQHNDGLVIRNAIGYQQPVFVSFSTNDIQMLSPEEGRLESSQLRFDSTLPDGEAMAGVWTTAKKKLSLALSANSLHHVWNTQFWALQLQQIAHVHPHWQFMKVWEEFRLKYYRKTAQLHSVADAVVRQMAWMGKEQLSTLHKFTLGEYRNGKHYTELVAIEVDGRKGYWEHRPTVELLDKLKAAGIDTTTPSGAKFLHLYIDAKNALQRQQDEMERVVLQLRIRKYGSDSAKMMQAIAEVRQDFAVRRNTPFWPQQTFGKLVVQVYGKDSDGLTQLLYEAGTDSEVEADQLIEKAKNRFKGRKEKLTFSIKERNPEEAIIMRMPVEFIDEVADALGMSQDNPADQAKLQELRDLMQSLYTKKTSATYDPTKALVEGGSNDFVRNFADFSLRNSNFIAKMEFRKNFDVASNMAKGAIEVAQGNERGTLRQARKLMDDSVKYMMNPTEEMHQFRAFAALTYLWANVKTAALNVWGFMNTWAYLNRTLGYTKGTRYAVSGAVNSVRTLGHEGMTEAMQWMQGAAKDAMTSVTDPTWEMKEGQPTELRQAVEQAKRENVLDQSYAYYLAGQAMRGELIRAASRSVGGKAFKFTIDAGMAPFRVTELALRRGTFISVYRALQKTKPGLTPEARYEETVKTVGLLQGDYTKGNRPRIMRGSVMSLITLFMTYVHNAAWAGYGGMEMGLRRQEALDGRASPGWYRSYTVQMMLLYFFAAGLQGLPFAENMLDVIDAILKRINNGKGARTLLREYLSEQLEDPKDVMRVMSGWSFDVGGVDVSRSIGLGRIVPGTDTLVNEHNNAKDFIGDVTVGVSGLAGGYVSWGIDTVLAWDKVANGMPLVDAMGKQLTRLPGGIGNMAKANEWATIGARGPAGGLLAHDLETGKAREITDQEIALKALGFQPSSVSVTQSAKSDKNDVENYWLERRKSLLANNYYAKYIMKDREAIADVRKAIKKYNESVPSPKMRLGLDTLKKSEEARLKSEQRETGLQSKTKMMEDSVREVREQYGLK